MTETKIAIAAPLRTAHAGGEIRCIHVSPDGQFCATASADGRAIVWNMHDCMPLMSVENGEDWTPVNSVAFSPDSRWLAIASDRGSTPGNTVELHDLETGEKIVIPETAGARLVAFNPEGAGGAERSGRGEIIVYNPEGKSNRKALAMPGGTSALAFSPDARLLACGTFKEVKLWSTADFVELHPITCHSGYVTGLAFSPDGRSLVSTSKELAMTRFPRA